MNEVLIVSDRRGTLQLMIRAEIIASVIMAFCRGWLTGYVVVFLCLSGRALR